MLGIGMPLGGEVRALTATNINRSAKSKYTLFVLTVSEM